MYTPEMLESIRKVEATRAARMGVEPRRMTAEEKDELLRAFHPDYRPEGFKEIKVGPNKGQKAPVELTNLLHANSRLLSGAPDLNKIDYDVDVLVIGGGAGACAAIEADEAGAKVMIVTKLRIGDANTMMAEGGIQAADKENDSPVQHYLDAFGGGHFAARPELLRRLVMEAPDAIQWLNNLGVMFDKDADGRMITTHGGGTSRKRMHACKDYSGAEIMRTVRDEVLNRKIPVVEFTSAVELLKDENGQVAASLSELPHFQSLRRNRRRPDSGLPRRRTPAVSGYHPVSPHRGAVPQPDLRRIGDREGSLHRCHAGQPGGRSLYAPAGDPRRFRRIHHPGVFRPGKGRSHAAGRRCLAGHSHDRAAPRRGYY